MSSKLLYPFLELSHALWFVPVLQVACKVSSSCRYIRLRFQVVFDDTNEGSAVIPNSTTPLTLTVTYSLSITTYFYTIEAANRAGQCCPVTRRRPLRKVSQPLTCGRHKASIRILSSTIFCIHVYHDKMVLLGQYTIMYLPRSDTAFLPLQI